MPDQASHTLPPAVGNVTERLLRIFSRNRAGERLGTYAVCSAHPAVLEAGAKQAVADQSLFHVESTSSQVNQFGGYTGMRPADFGDAIRRLASECGLPEGRVLLGADHLGPFAWRKEKASDAMAKGCELAKAVVRAGYQKIHLDASMTCADDGESLREEVIAERAALLCQAAEAEANASGGTRPLYVVGTEVPPPGGEVAEGTCPPPTRVEDVHRARDLFRAAFAKKHLEEAWERVVAIVVQPGVEFGDTTICDYDPMKAADLRRGLPEKSTFVYEAHSTDYQPEGKLAALVQDRFAILKVGPWLTFAYREAVFALSMIEREVLRANSATRLSQVREALDAAMLRDPGYWKSYYKGESEIVALARAYSYSDRSRYYWPEPSVQAEVALLLRNLATGEIPETLLSQYMPLEYEAVRDHQLASRPEKLIQYHIQHVLKKYARACGVARA